MVIKKEDQNLFRERLPRWQENYTRQLLKDYVAFLDSDGVALDKFWTLEKMIKKDKNTPGVQMRLSDKNLDDDLVKLIASRVIKVDDLNGFSNELKETVTWRIEQLSK